MIPTIIQIVIAASTGSPIPNPKLKELLLLSPCDDIPLLFSAVVFSTTDTINDIRKYS